MFSPKKFRKTTKQLQYEYLIDELTHRVCECPINEFFKVQIRLFAIKEEYEQYMKQLAEKRNG